MAHHKIGRHSGLASETKRDSMGRYGTSVRSESIGVIRSYHSPFNLRTVRSPFPFQRSSSATENQPTLGGRFPIRSYLRRQRPKVRVLSGVPSFQWLSHDLGSPYGKTYGKHRRMLWAKVESSLGDSWWRLAPPNRRFSVCGAPRENQRAAAGENDRHWGHFSRSGTPPRTTALRRHWTFGGDAQAHL